MNKQEIKTENAPEAIGPYSQGIAAGNMVFVSGQIPIDPKTGQLEDEITRATTIVFGNMEAVLKAANLTLSDVVKTTVFLNDLSDFPQMNKVYQEFFTHPYPARSTVEAARLPRNAIIEAECIAYKK